MEIETDIDGSRDRVVLVTGSGDLAAVQLAEALKGAGVMVIDPDHGIRNEIMSRSFEEAVLYGTSELKDFPFQSLSGYTKPLMARGWRIPNAEREEWNARVDREKVEKKLAKQHAKNMKVE